MRIPRPESPLLLLLVVVLLLLLHCCRFAAVPSEGVEAASSQDLGRGDLRHHRLERRLYRGQRGKFLVIDCYRRFGGVCFRPR